MHRLALALAAIAAAAGCGKRGFDGTALDGLAADDAHGDPDLLVWLPLDDDPLPGVVDRAGTLAPGVCDGPCPMRVTGRIGGAYDFAGTTGGAIRFASVPALDFSSQGTPMSIALWYRTRSLAPALQQVAFAKPVAGGQVSYQLALEDLEENGSLDVVFRVCASGCEAEAVAALPGGAELDVWRLLVGTWDGNVSSLYIDGVLRSAQAKDSFDFDGSPLILGADLEVGGIEDVFDGLIDDVRIYRRVLDAGDQAELLAR